MLDNQGLHTANKRLVKKILLVVAGMFVFAVGIMPPMYDVLCDITGLNGKTSNEAAGSAEMHAVSKERTVTVQFLADTDPAMPWEFFPNVRSMEIHPGQIYKVDFHVRNPRGESMAGQAIPSVSPARATAYFKKTECFCFEQQILEARGEIDMPLMFYVDPGLPENIGTITLSYQLYNITERMEKGSLAAK